MTPDPLYTALSGLPGSVWTVAENLAPQRFDSRTVQLIASGYTDSATAVHYDIVYLKSIVVPLLSLASVNQSLSISLQMVIIFCLQPSLHAVHMNAG
jgi:hypothetical protein